MVKKGDNSNGNKEGKVTAYCEFVTKHCLKPKAFEHDHNTWNNNVVPLKTAIGSQSGIDQSLHKPLLLQKMLNTYITLLHIAFYCYWQKGRQRYSYSENTFIENPSLHDFVHLSCQRSYSEQNLSKRGTKHNQGSN